MVYFGAYECLTHIYGLWVQSYRKSGLDPLNRLIVEIFYWGCVACVVDYLKDLRKPVDGTIWDTVFVKQCRLQFGSLCRHVDFQGQMGIGREGTKSLCFHLWQREWINFPECTLNYIKLLVYAFVIWSPLWKHFKVARNEIMFVVVLFHI